VDAIHFAILCQTDWGMNSMRGLVKKTCKFMIIIALFAIVFYQVDFSVALSNIKTINGGTFFVGLSLMLASILVAGLRWWCVLLAIGIRVKFWTVFSLHYSSLFTNFALPGTVGGELLKIWRLNKIGVSYSKAINSIIIDRTAIIAATVVVALALPYYLWPQLMLLKDNMVLMLIGAIATTIILLLTWKLIAPKFTALVAPLKADATLVTRKPTYLATILSLTFLCNFINSLIFYLITISLAADISIYACLVMIPVVILLCFLPITYSGWGIRELSLIYGYTALGLPKEVALAASVLYGILMMLGSLPGGLFLLTKTPDALVSTE
jgi:uncharacterized membrane protein YbhN (UPF0104 family)